MSRLIEQCLEMEELEEKEYSHWTLLKLGTGTILIIVDPYMINMEDLQNVKPGQANLIRIRRPGWGRGDVSNYIMQMEIK